MAESSAALVPSSGCLAPQLYDLVTEYSFDQLTAQDMIVVENHLAVCPTCGQTVDKLQEGLSVLRFDSNNSQNILATEAAGAFGVSGKLKQLFGGHAVFVLLSCGVYALFHAVSVAMEFGKTESFSPNHILKVSLLVVFAIFFQSVIGLSLLWKRTAHGKSRPMFYCLGVLCLGTSLLIIVLFFGLPPPFRFDRLFPQEALYDDSLRIYVANLSLCVFYFVIPYHFILSIQRELQMKRHAFVLALLRHERGSVPPRGTLYLKCWWLMAILAPMAYFVWQNMEWLLQANNTRSWPNKNLFTTSILTHWFCFFALGAIWMIWYQYKLNEVKRECVIVEAFSKT